jgi:cystathionine beta-synthase
MFDFTALHEVVTDPTDVSLLSLDERAAGGRAAGEAGAAKRRQKFVEITRDTPLTALSRFFEWNSAAVVTERDGAGGLKAVAVVTKVDLLSWMVRAKKNQNGA